MSHMPNAAHVAFLDTYAPAPEGFRVAYADGSSTGLTEGAAGWAWYADDAEWSAGGIVQGTNNVAEVMALREALRYFTPDTPLLLVSDSQYAINAVCVWYSRWAERGWVSSLGEPVANADLIREARAALEARTARTLVKHVRGHGKDPEALEEDFLGNRMADMLAKSARLACAAKGEDTLLDSFSWNIIHGRGRKKLPFLETEEQTREYLAMLAEKESARPKKTATP